MHWSFKYLGLPWEAGARGPDAFDCWGLCVSVYRQELAIDLPSFLGVDARNGLKVARIIRKTEEDFQQVILPKEFDLVTISRNCAPRHIGIFVEEKGGLILHAQENANTILSSFSQLKSLGFNGVKFYR